MHRCTGGRGGRCRVMSREQFFAASRVCRRPGRSLVTRNSAARHRPIGFRVDTVDPAADTGLSDSRSFIEIVSETARAVESIRRTAEIASPYHHSRFVIGRPLRISTGLPIISELHRRFPVRWCRERGGSSRSIFTTRNRHWFFVQNRVRIK